MPEIEDIVETTETAPLLLWWQWALIVIGVILILITIKILMKPKPKAPTPVNSLKSALERLQQIQQADPSDTELATEVSLLTREYLQHQFQNKSLFQTHQEFSQDQADLEKLPEQARANLSHYLKVLAEHKYSPNSHLPTEKQKLIQHTETLLRGIDSTVPKPII